MHPLIWIHHRKFMVRDRPQAQQLPGDQLMNKNQINVNESDEKGKVKEATNKVTDDKKTKKKHQTEKPGGKHEAVLADVNNDSKKETK
jgi:uncharacterized protein YjbJ (UPF0337 family)